MTKVAALYVATDGAYFGLPDVDPWDAARDACLYAGPWPVVAHPPCKHWSRTGQCRGLKPTWLDVFTFESALDSVHEWGGVLEHPAHSKAWAYFGLPYPPLTGWSQRLDGGGWACEVDQAHYGHRANKRTWLYYAGDDPPPLRWGPAPPTGLTVRNDGGGGRDQRSKTPPEFRDLLLGMARTAQARSAA